MKNKVFRGIVLAASVVCCSLCLCATPVATLTAEAAVRETTISPQADIKEWVLKEEDGKLWKRLWNASKLKWETDWIYVRDL